MKKKKIVLIIIVLGIIIFLIIQMGKRAKTQDDIIFFKLFRQEKIQENKENEEYETQNAGEEIYLKVSYQNINFKQVHLLNTANINNNVYQKIAPGTRRRIFNNIIFK